LPAAIWAKAPGDVKSYRGTLNASSIPGQNQKFGRSGSNNGLALAAGETALSAAKLYANTANPFKSVKLALSHGQRPMCKGS
jgi:hypothetical protein